MKKTQKRPKIKIIGEAYRELQGLVKRYAKTKSACFVYW